MSRLRQLSEILGQRLSLDASRSLGQTDQLDRPLQELNANSRAGLSAAVPIDQQLAAINKFRKSQELVTLREARLVAYGLCLRVSPGEEAIIDNSSFLTAALSSHSGVGQWAGNPLSFRRCYQGLVSSYFAYDKHAKERSNVALSNWQRLGEYLYRENNRIVDAKANPDWVKTASDHRDLFGPDPCAPYASDALDGDPTVLPYLEQQLGIGAGSWFRQELVLAVVREATLRPDEQFKRFIPRLLRLLQDHEAQEHEGLALILDKYAASIGGEADPGLRDLSVELWGSPWLPSNEPRWSRVTKPARDMVSYWLRRDFVEAFFTKLAQDGIGDRRRANFWLRYINSMQNIQFALGSQSLTSRDRDFVALRRKMEGLYTELQSTDSANNAFIMTFGTSVAVELGASNNALYVYDRRHPLPFSLAMPVVTAVNGRNSVRHSSRALKLTHRDGVRGTERWEQLFEQELREKFNILPDQPRGQEDARERRASVRELGASFEQHPAFSMRALREFADMHGLRIEDNQNREGNIWIRAGAGNFEVRSRLEHWNFRYYDRSGWLRTERG